MEKHTNKQLNVTQHDCQIIVTRMNLPGKMSKSLNILKLTGNVSNTTVVHYILNGKVKSL